MKSLQKLKLIPFIEWVSSDISLNLRKNLPKPLFSFCFRSSYSSRAAAEADKCSENLHILDEIKTPRCNSTIKVSKSARLEAQAALLEYLHGTRNLPFSDAEHMSKNSPNFLDKLLRKVDDEQRIGQYLTKFFRYHPINEFEPFLESLGLKPSEIDVLLPRDLMFLNEDDLLVENYHVLCNYGIDRSKLGKIYREVREVFGYDYGVLRSKLQAYEDLGLNQSTVIKVVVSSPCLLVGGVNQDFVEVLEMLKNLGIEHDWVGGHLSEKSSYKWREMLRLLSFFGEITCGEEEAGIAIRRLPGLLLDGSGTKAFSLIGLLVKLGFREREMLSLFMQFPRIQVGTFIKNFRQVFLFLVEIEMEANEIGRIYREHCMMIGSCRLKKTNSIMTSLNVGKKRLCSIIKGDPHQLKNWILGMKINPLPNSGEDEKSLKQKTEFLLKLGFVKNSEEMKKSLKVFRGRGGELQERFDCFIKAGLDRKIVLGMIKIAPQVLNQSKDVIESKINFLVNGLGYPISSLATFPSYISYTVERVKLRFSMYGWLIEQGVVAPGLALSTLLACSDKIFVKQYVKQHPKGPEVWENLKKEHNS